MELEMGVEMRFGTVLPMTFWEGVAMGVGFEDGIRVGLRVGMKLGEGS
jgi:hypothetical protein